LDGAIRWNGCQRVDQSLFLPSSVGCHARRSGSSGREPAEAQAAIWAFTKAFTEHGETDPEMIKQYSEDFADLIGHDPDIQAQLKELGINQETLDEHIAKSSQNPRSPPNYAYY